MPLFNDKGENKVAIYREIESQFTAPELFDQSKPYRAQPVDIFALGVLMFQLLNQNPPWVMTGAGEQGMYQPFIDGKPEKMWEKYDKMVELRRAYSNSAESSMTFLYSTPEPLTQDFKNFFNGSVAFNPDERFTLQELINHPWMKGDRATPEELVKELAPVFEQPAKAVAKTEETAPVKEEENKA